MPHSETEIDGEQIPSVTQALGVIAKPFLYRWYGKNGWDACEEIKRTSSEFGTEFHDTIERRLGGESVTLDHGPVQDAVERFFKWADEAEFKHDLLEHKVISQKHRFAGTFDAVGTLAGEGPYIFDWKSSNSISDDYGLQLAAYAAGYEEQDGVSVKGGVIVRVSKDPTAKKPLEVKKYSADHLQKLFPVFLSAVEIWLWANKKGKWAKGK